MASANNIAPADAVNLAIKRGDDFLAHELRFGVVNSRLGMAALSLEMPISDSVHPSVYRDASQVASRLPTDRTVDVSKISTLMEIYTVGHNAQDNPWKTPMAFASGAYDPLIYPLSAVEMQEVLAQNWTTDELAGAVIARFQHNIAEIRSNPDDYIQMDYYGHLKKVVTKLGLQDMLLPTEQQ